MPGECEEDEHSVDELEEYEDDIGPDDSVSVAWMSSEERCAACHVTHAYARAHTCHACMCVYAHGASRYAAREGWQLGEA